MDFMVLHKTDSHITFYSQLMAIITATLELDDTRSIRNDEIPSVSVRKIQADTMN